MARDGIMKEGWDHEGKKKTLTHARIRRKLLCIAVFSGLVPRCAYLLNALYRRGLQPRRAKRPMNTHVLRNANNINGIVPLLHGLDTGVVGGCRK